MSSSANKSYFYLAKEAITDLKDRTGSSLRAIKSWILARYPKMDFGAVRLLLFVWFCLTVFPCFNLNAALSECSVKTCSFYWETEQNQRIVESD
jgi:hypothetical protein